MKKITKEHRVLDDTDLNNINNTFKLIEKTCESTNKRIDSLIWVVGVGFVFINFGFVILGILIKMS